MSEPNPAPEPGTVPNGSRVPEGSGVPKVPDLAAMVRSMATVEPPAKRGHANGLTDEALETLARTLADRLGRLPTGAELIDAAGGCQKQRALRAIQALRLKRAEQEVTAMLVLPPAVDAELRSLMSRWLGLAGQQLAGQLAQAQSHTELQLQQAADAAGELEHANESLRTQILDLQKVQRELISRVNALQSKLEVACRDRDTATALAAERERVMAAVISSREVPHAA
jgi:chaperonin cofactor prefoldin